MRALFALLLLAVPALPATIITDQIPVRGGGSFNYDSMDGDISINLFSDGIGTDGDVNLSLFYRADCCGFFGAPDYRLGVSGGNNGHNCCSASVAGIGSQWFHFSLDGGTGTGSLEIYQDQAWSTLLAQAPLIGFIGDYHKDRGPGFMPVTTGGFTVSPTGTAFTPEPATWFLFAVGAAFLLAIARCRPA